MKLLILFIFVLFIGCTSTPHMYQANGSLVPKGKAREAWFKDLSKTNPELHAALLKAMFASKAYNKQIYVYKQTIKDRKFYLVSQENRQGNNVLSVEYNKKIIHFDHYGDDDGKPMDYFVDLTYINGKIEKLHEELKVKEFN